MSGLRVNRDLVPSNLKSQRRVGDCVRSIRLLGFGLEGAFHRRWNGWSELNLEHHSIVLVGDESANVVKPAFPAIPLVFFGRLSPTAYHQLLIT
jgi:hypothetical protein